MEVWYIHFQPKVWYNQNFIRARCNRNLEKIMHIKDVKNIYLA